jgi:colicin import membrane protein
MAAVHFSTSPNAGTVWLPPTDQRWGWSIGLALCAHLLLIAALAWGVRWKQETQPTSTVQAELWSSLPPPPPPPAPAIENADPPPPPKPQPAPIKPPSPPSPPSHPQSSTPAPAKVDIALEQAKKAQQQRLLAEQQELAKQKAQKEADEKKAKEIKLKKEKEAQGREAAEKLEKEKRAKLEREKGEREKVEREKKLAHEKLEKEKAEKQRLEQEKKAQQQQLAEEKARKEERQRHIQQMMSQAGNNASSSEAGGGTRTGNANFSAKGPSSGYGGKIQAAVRPNIIFTGSITGNPVATVDVRLLPDGTIASRKIDKSSGVPAWDKAVLDALDRTHRFPKDEGGRVPSTIVIDFRPNP